MALTPTQLVTLKNDILADPVLAAYPSGTDAAYAIAALYGLPASPDFWVWQTRVTQEDIVGLTTPAPDNTSWSWTIFIGRSQGERDAWREMFANAEKTINASRLNVRQGLADIFSGGTGAAQRTHLLAIGRRLATRAEKLFATGAGTIATPATMTIEGHLAFSDLQLARELP